MTVSPLGGVSIRFEKPLIPASMVSSRSAEMRRPSAPGQAEVSEISSCAVARRRPSGSFAGTVLANALRSVARRPGSVRGFTVGGRGVDRRELAHDRRRSSLLLERHLVEEPVEGHRRDERVVVEPGEHRVEQRGFGVPARRHRDRERRASGSVARSRRSRARRGSARRAAPAAPLPVEQAASRPSSVWYAASCRPPLSRVNGRAGVNCGGVVGRHELRSA